MSSQVRSLMASGDGRLLDAAPGITLLDHTGRTGAPGPHSAALACGGALVSVGSPRAGGAARRTSVMATIRANPEQTARSGPLIRCDEVIVIFTREPPLRPSMLVASGRSGSCLEPEREQHDREDENGKNHRKHFIA